MPLAPDHLAIADLIARYHRAIDEGDSTVTRAAMTDDAAIEVEEGGRAFKLEGADQIIAVQSQRGAAQSEIAAQHILGPLIIDQDGDKARVRAYQSVYQYQSGVLAAPANSAGTNNVYDLVRRDGRWLIKRSSVRILWMTGAPVHT